MLLYHTALEHLGKTALKTSHQVKAYRNNDAGVIAQVVTGAAEVYEYPMIDRDPVSNWADGNVALLGDAAHVMYPTGSNGASQAIVDARVLGANLIKYGVSNAALHI